MSSLTAFASAARTATPTAYSFSPGRCRALRVVIDTTAAGTSPSTVPTVEGLDSATGKWTALITGAAITAVGTVALEVGLGVAAVANLAAGKPLADSMRISMTHGNGTSHTYTVGITLIK